jgi:hypothetical protein
LKRTLVRGCGDGVDRGDEQRGDGGQKGHGVRAP